MPIINVGNDGNKEIYFGTGDIKIIIGWSKEDRSIGALELNQGEPGSIGVWEEHSPYLSPERGSAPVRMLFSNVESVDCLIDLLEKMKVYMMTNQ